MKSYLNKILWITIIIFVIRCLILMPKSIYDIYSCTGETIAIVAFFKYLYEQWLWRYMPFASMPKLYREYQGVIKSDYDGNEYKATLYIKQSLLHVQVTLTTNESESSSISVSIDDILGKQQLTYCYLNTPNAAVRSRSQIHYGTVMLNIDNPKKLSGRYFTDRKTTGDMEFKVISIE